MITYIIHCNMLTNRKTSIARSNRGSALTVLSMRTEALGEYNTGCTVRVGYTDHMTCAEKRK